jgi:hypothetical protein
VDFFPFLFLIGLSHIYNSNRKQHVAGPNEILFDNWEMLGNLITNEELSTVCCRTNITHKAFILVYLYHRSSSGKSNGIRRGREEKGTKMEGESAKKIHQNAKPSNLSCGFW